MCMTHYPGVAQLVGRLVWDQDAASSSLATRTKSPESALRGVWTFLFVWSETRKIKCGADERRRRGLDRADPLSAPFGADANETRHSDQKSRIRFCGVWAFLFLWSETRTIKCNAGERCRRQLDGGEPLSAQSADANESRHSDQNR